MVPWNVPMEPSATVPKLQAVGGAVPVMTAPKGCMTRLTVCAVSFGISVVTVRTSLKVVTPPGLATAAGIADGAIVTAVLPPMGTGVGVAAMPGRVNGDVAP